MIAWCRCVLSAATVSRVSAGTVVKNAAPQVEQGALPGGLVPFRVRVRDPAHDEQARDLVRRLLRGERGEGDLGDLGPGDPLPGGLVADRVGVLDRGPRALVDARDRGLDRGGEPA